jgi:two-component system, cell cycle sensor histidine kinase and response regulator CckA
MASISRLSSGRSTESPLGRRHPAHLLLVEDQPDHAALIEVQLSSRSAGHWRIEHAETLHDAISRAARAKPDVVILDLNLPDSRGLATVDTFCRAHPDLPVVVATVEDDESLGVEAIRRGAQDYLVKGLIAPELVGRSLDLAVARKEGSRAAARLASIIAASDDAIVGLDLGGVITSWNRGAEVMFGCNAQDAIGTPMAALWRRDGQDEWPRILEHIRAGDHVPSAEATLARRDGSHVAVSMSLSPIVEGTRGHVGSSLIARDMSEQWHAAEAVRRSREHLKAVVDNEPDCLKTVSADGTIVEMNAAGLEMLDGGAVDVVGRPVTDFVHTDDHARLAEAQRRAGRGERVRVEYRIVSLSGRTRSVESIMTSLPRAVDAGDVVLSVTRDVTEQRVAAESLRQSEERYRTLFDANPEAMWVFDADTQRFLAVNAAACRRYGYSREEFLHMTLADLEASDDTDRARPSSARAGHQMTDPVPTRQRTKDGRILLVQATSNPIQFDGHRAELVLAVDVTDRNRFEEQLRQAQKMEALGRLAGGVAHDFNNLLGVITGYSEMAIRSLDGSATAARRLEEVVKAARRAADLTQQLLAFSRKQVLEPRVLDLDESVAEAGNLLRRLIGEDVQFVAISTPGLGRVKADPGQITQIIMNLALNARDAMPRGGRLTIETANAEITESRLPLLPEAKPGRYVMLAVTDTGHGIDPETRVRMFEPFFTTKEPGKGTGLGLATVYGIVRQSGGHIEVYSELGKGSTFKVYLPRVDAPADASETTPAGPARGGTEKILLVEDDPALQAMIREVLEDAGYRVVAAAAGDVAVELISRPGESIDLMITDVVMPRMTGPELARRVSARLGGVPVLYMSGYTEGAILESSDLPRESSFLSKPFSPDELLVKVRDLLDVAGGNGS